MWGARGREREKRGEEEEAGSFNSEVKHVVVGGAGDLKGADRRFERSTFTLNGVRIH